jgi:hypothetical protein
LGKIRVNEGLGDVSHLSFNGHEFAAVAILTEGFHRDYAGFKHCLQLVGCGNASLVFLLALRTPASSGASTSLSLYFSPPSQKVSLSTTH